MNQLSAATQPIGVLTQPISVVRGRTVSWRYALEGVFASSGFASAIWAARIPEVRASLGLAPQQLSLLLFGVSIGSITGLLLAPRLIAWLGARTVLAGSACGLATSLVLIAASATGLRSAPATCAVLVLFGFSLSATSLTMNVDATTIEKLGRHALMPMMHACYSGGTVAGAAVAVAAAHLHVGLVPLFAIAAGVVLGLVTLALLRVPGEHTSVRRYSRFAGGATGAASAPASRFAWMRDPRLLCIGVMVLGMSFVEGTANDWLSLAAIDGHGLDATGGTLVYATFVGGMLVGRVGGGRLIDHLGRRLSLLVMGSLAVAGVIAFIVAPTPVLAVAASAIWGLGVSLGFPVGMSIAADLPGDTRTQVGVVSAFGYTASLVGPVVIGFAAAGVGLLGAFLLVLLTSAVSLALVPVVCRKRQRA